MILRNPAALRDSFFILMVMLWSWCMVPQKSDAQGITGHVMSSLSAAPVPNAQVILMHQDSILAETQTSEQGAYSLWTEFAGRVSLRITDTLFADYLLPDILLDGYSTLRLDHYLTRNLFSLPGVTITADRNRTTDFVQTITPEDMLKVAGNFEDPIRIAHSLPGVVLLNDQANFFSARGQSPLFNSWFLEGMEIVNPNHTNNAGTLSDLPTSYGGGINMFSAQILGNTDVYMGTAPLAFGHTSGAAIDMHLHETVKPEWRAKAGLIGFELGGGNEIGGHSILDVNLRYSFTGLLTNLGADFGGERIGFYDGVISFLDQTDQHKLKLFAWGGRSTNAFDRVEPAADREEYKDFFDIDYSNDIAGAGGRYELHFGSGMQYTIGAVFSSDQPTYAKQGRFNADSIALNFDERLSIFDAFTELRIQHSERYSSTLGLRYTDKSYAHGFLFLLPFFDISLGKIRYEGSMWFGPKTNFEFGVAGLYTFKTKTIDPEYQAKLTSYIGRQARIFASLHHSVDETQLLAPKENHFLRGADQVEIGYGTSGIAQDFTLRLYMNRIQGLGYYENFGAFGYFPDYPIPNYGTVLVWDGTDGTFRSFGAEAELHHIQFAGFFLDINQSVYKSERGNKVIGFSPGRYDGRYTTQVALSKEWIKKRLDKNRIWNLSVRGLVLGGLWEPAIDLESSKAREETIVQYPGNFDQHLPAFKRIDAGLTRTISTPKIRWRYSLDIQNLLGLTNIAYHYYDPFLDEIKAQEHLGLIPVLSVQASW